MSSLFIYLLKSSIILIVLYSGYELFLRKEAYFRFNRLVLLFTVAAAALVPFFSYNTFHVFTAAGIYPHVTVSSQMTQYTLEEVIVYANNGVFSFFREKSLAELFLVIYLTGICFKLTQLLYRLFRLQNMISRSKTTKAGGVTFVWMKKGSPTHSFLHWLFIDPQLAEQADDFKRIVAHENVHIRRKHTIDLLLAELLAIIQWFNPFVYLLKARMKENHEYLADSSPELNATSSEAYSALLIRLSSPISTNILTHNFSYSLLKRRLHMMKKPKRPFHFILGISLVTILFVLVIFACSSPEREDTGYNEVLTEVDVYPEFPGGMDGLMHYLSENINYPAQAIDSGIEGRVFVNFIVEKDGSVGEPKILRGIGSGCDQEAIRVIKEMPKWKPGMHNDRVVRVSYNLPVLFKLDRKEQDSVFTLVETMPSFPGGTSALMNFLSSNINYPEQAKKDSIQGRVYINFIVEKDGRVRHVTLLRGIGGGCDEEAMRVVSIMPPWKPGTQHGEAVRVSYNVPIKFVLD